MAHRPLRCWSRAQQQRLETAVEDLSRAWRRDWGIASRPANEQARCTLASDVANGQSPASSWKGAPTAAAAGRLWWDCPSLEAGTADGADLLVQALFDGQYVMAGADLAASVARDAWSEFWQRVAGQLVPDGASDAATLQQCFQPWSGAVVITLPWCGSELSLLLAGAAVERFLGANDVPARAAAPAPSPLWDALAPLQCSLRVELEPVELTLGAVDALRIGDVVELPHRLEAPLLARTGDGLLCEAWLGKVAGHRGIELMRAPARSH